MNKDDLFELARCGKLTSSHLVGKNLFDMIDGGWTMLHYAAINNRHSCIKLLLETKWIKNRYGWTAFHYATEFIRDLETVKLLLSTKLMKTNKLAFDLRDDWTKSLINRHFEKEMFQQDIFPLTFLSI